MPATSQAPDFRVKRQDELSQSYASQPVAPPSRIDTLDIRSTPIKLSDVTTLPHILMQNGWPQLTFNIPVGTRQEANKTVYFIDREDGKRMEWVHSQNATLVLLPHGKNTRQDRVEAQYTGGCLSLTHPDSRSSMRLLATSKPDEVISTIKQGKYQITSNNSGDSFTFKKRDSSGRIYMSLDGNIVKLSKGFEGRDVFGDVVYIDQVTRHVIVRNSRDEAPLDWASGYDFESFSD
ncbi:MAG: hypothetical protein O3A01_04140 [bacterium]|nr:hypothetical protein [bacterium]